MKKKPVVLILILAVGAFMFAACSSDKGPAEQAIKAAEDAVNAAKGEAAKYIPSEVKSIEDALAAAKDKLAKGDYKAALGEAQGLVGKAGGLAEAAKAKKEELTKAWTDYNEQLPKMVAAIQSRVDILSKSKKLPANLTAETFEEVKNGLSAAKEEWDKAQQGFQAGNLADAVSLAGSVKERAVKAMETLGLPVPSGSS